jgi:hypothetical protein
MSNLLGINDKMRGDLKDKPANMDSTNKAMNLIISLLWVAALVAMIVFATQSSNLIYVFVLMGLLFGFIAFMRNNTNFNISRKYSIAINSILLMPMLRWDLLYLGAKYIIGILGIIYAGFTIKNFQEIPTTSPCLFDITHIRQLYIAFISFLIIFYTFNTLSAANLTSLITIVMRYLVPPSLFGMSAYLVYLTNALMNLSPQLIVN